MSDEAAAWLQEVDAQRSRARRDRQGYWLPLLLLGLLILGAPLVYRSGEHSVYRGGERTGPANLGPLTAFGPRGLSTGNPTAVGLYWLGAVVLGLLVTIAWYRWRAQRVGVETPTLAVLLVGSAGLVLLLVVVPFVTRALVPALNAAPAAAFWLSTALFVVSTTVVTVALWAPRADRLPRWRAVVAAAGVVVALLSADVLFLFTTTHGFAPLLIIGVAVLALAAVERSVLCAVVAVLFTLSALLANLYDMENQAYRLGLMAGPGGAADPSLVAFANLVLPAAVLIVGGGLAALVTRQAAR
jgi:hypothetical protein